MATKTVTLDAPKLTVISVRAAADNFFKDLTVQTGKPPARELKSYVNRFVECIGPEKPMYKITAEDFDRYMHTFAGREPGTLNNALSRSKRFLKWAVAKRYMSPWDYDNPTQAWKSRKVPQHKREWIGRKNFPKLIEIGWEKHPIYGIFTAFGLYTMFRGPSEGRPLQIRDLDLDTEPPWVTIVRTKTASDPDKVPIVGELKMHLYPYLLWYDGYLQRVFDRRLQKDDYLFPATNAMGHRGGPDNWMVHPRKMRSRENITNLSCYVLETFGFTVRDMERLTPKGVPMKNREGASHAFRRFGARALYDALVAQGYDGALMVVKAWLGHGPTTDTARYIGIDYGKALRNARVAENGGNLYPATDGAVTELITRQLPGELVGADLFAAQDPDALKRLEKEAATALPWLWNAA